MGRRGPYGPYKKATHPDGKACSVCKVRFKDIPANFYRAGPSRPGQWFSQCKSCHLENLRQRRASPERAKKFRDYMREWRRKHPERSRVDEARRRAREAAAGPSYSSAHVKAQYIAQSGRCYWCKEQVASDYHVDHVIPLSKGGSNGSDNIVIACPPCNRKKCDKMPWEFAGVLL